MNREQTVAYRKPSALPALDLLLERQMEAWLRGERLEIEALVAEFPGLNNDGRLVALIENEMALREAVGESPCWEEYQKRYGRQLAGLAGKTPSLARPPEPPLRSRADLPSLKNALDLVPPPKRAETLPVVEEITVNESHVVSEDQAPKPQGEDVPGYEILGELGRGGMGVVYKARQKSLNRVVALKMILGGIHADAEDITRFKLEADAVGQLRHPNIVQIFDIGESDGRAYFSLEFVEGGTLDRKLDRSTLSGLEAGALVESLARAMQTVHDQGIVHRDLKPGNVLLTQDGTPKITDFGLAKQLHDDSGRTQSGSVMGTPSYMAPEQAEGRVEDIGPASDIYSLGAILYCTLAGRPPFKGATTMETIRQVINDEPMAPSRLQPNVPRDLETICLKCLAKQPHRRYGSAAELADDLLRYLNGEPIHARSMGRTERLWRWCRRHPVAASLLLTVVAGSAFGMGYLSQLSQQVVRSSALQSATQQAEMLENLNNFYSDEIVKRSGIKTSHDYKNQPRTLPTPATLTIDLGQYISDHSEMGQQIRVFSDYPFLHRKARNEGGPRDDFEVTALDHLRAQPDVAFERFETLQGRPVLRYAKARVMKASCVDCHNHHELSPKKDWQVGDVRGVVEIIRPLDVEQQKASRALRSTLVLIGGFCAALLAFSSLVFVLGRKTRRQS